MLKKKKKLLIVNYIEKMYLQINANTRLVNEKRKKALAVLLEIVMSGETDCTKLLIFSYVTIILVLRIILTKTLLKNNQKDRYIRTRVGGINKQNKYIQKIEVEIER